MSLFGLPFLAAGVFLLLAATGVVPFENADELPGWAPAVVFLVGAAFSAVGGGLVFGRRWTTLDTGRRRIVKEWGLLVPLRREEHWIEDHEAVVLRRDEGDSDSADTWPVLLRARSGTDLVLSRETDFAKARGQAEEVARYLGFPLVDATTRQVSEAAADRVGASFRERLRDGDQEVWAPSRPPRLRSQVREHHSGAEIVIPGPGFARSRLVMLAASGTVFAWAAPGILRFFDATRTPHGVQMAALGFLGFFFVVLPLLGVVNELARSQRARTVVEVSSTGIVVEERGAWRSRFTRVSADDILGLDYGTTDDALAAAGADARRRLEHSGRRPPPLIPGGREPGWARALRRLVPSKGVIVKTRSGLIPVGAGLPDDEVRWLHAVVARALGAP